VATGESLSFVGFQNLRTAVCSEQKMAVKPLSKQTLQDRIECAAVVFDLSPSTIRNWYYEGCDLWNVEELFEWARFKRSRRRNFHNGDKPARRVRRPF
jgi:hypothetical protein